MGKWVGVSSPQTLKKRVEGQSAAPFWNCLGGILGLAFPLTNASELIQRFRTHLSLIYNSIKFGLASIFYSVNFVHSRRILVIPGTEFFQQRFYYYFPYVIKQTFTGQDWVFLQTFTQNYPPIVGLSFFITLFVFLQFLNSTYLFITIRDN